MLMTELPSLQVYNKCKIDSHSSKTVKHEKKITQIQSQNI